MFEEETHTKGNEWRMRGLEKRLVWVRQREDSNRATFIPPHEMAWRGWVNLRYIVSSVN